jgi:peptidoglycan/LPS O-acetylase OafA/YrhL
MINKFNLENKIFQDTSTTGNKFSTLDGLRGFAVLIVFLSHTSGRDQTVIPALDFSGIGHLGVYLFFVLSGFLLTYSLLHRGKISIFNFYVRRFFRIAPLYYLVLLGVFIHQTVTGTVNERYLHISDGFRGLFNHLIFYQGDSVFWTIAAEFQFYLILPFLLLLLFRFGKAAIYALSALFVLYAIFYLLIIYKQVDSQYALRVALISHDGQFLDVFWCGMLAAFAYRSDRLKTLYLSSKKIVDNLMIALFSCMILVSLVAIASRFIFFSAEFFTLRYFSLLYGLFFAALLLNTLYGNRFFVKLFDLKILRIIGITGFGWYLLHFAIFQAVNHFFEFTPFNYGAFKFLVSFLTCFGVSILTYLWIEKPFMMLSKHFVDRRLTPSSKTT